MLFVWRIYRLFRLLVLLSIDAMHFSGINLIETFLHQIWY